MIFVRSYRSHIGFLGLDMGRFHEHFFGDYHMEKIPIHYKRRHLYPITVSIHPITTSFILLIATSKVNNGRMHRWSLRFLR